MSDVPFSLDNASHKAVARYDVGNHPAYHGLDEDTHDDTVAEEDVNYSMFDLNVDSIDVTLSLKQWLDGKGLVQDAVIKGVRGVLGLSVCDPPLNSIHTRVLLQIDDLFRGILTILLILLPTVIRHNLETFNLNRCNWKIS